MVKRRSISTVLHVAAIALLTCFLLAVVPTAPAFIGCAIPKPPIVSEQDHAIVTPSPTDVAGDESRLFDANARGKSRDVKGISMAVESEDEDDAMLVLKDGTVLGVVCVFVVMTLVLVLYRGDVDEGA